MKSNKEKTEGLPQDRKAIEMLSVTEMKNFFCFETIQGHLRGNPGQKIKLPLVVLVPTPVSLTKRNDTGLSSHVCFSLSEIKFQQTLELDCNIQGTEHRQTLSLKS